MGAFINYAALILLALVLYQDLKYRAISWVLLPLLAIVFVLKSLQVVAMGELLQESLINLSFIIAQLLVLTAFISLQQKAFVNIFKSHIGLGDLLFFVVSCTAFSFLNFVLFYTTGLLFVLLSFLLLKQVVKNTKKEVPLAGGLALFMMLIFIYEFMSQPFCFNNEFMFSLLGNY